VSCFVCGERGVADVVANIILFIPVGAVLGWAGVGWWRVWLIGVAFSGAIEYAQLFIPGRDSSLADVCTNSLGSVIGWALGQLIAAAARSPRRPSAPAAALASALATVAIVGTGVAWRPSFPPATYFGQWTPSLSHLEWYHGRVLRAELDTLPLPPDRLPALARQLLKARAALHVRAIAGPPPPGLGPLFSIADGDHREILLLGPNRRSWVFRYRTRAAAWRFSAPEIRVPAPASGTGPGDTLDIVVGPHGRDYCLTVARSITCGLGFTAGTGWALLEYPESWPDWLRATLGVVWIAAVWLPAGFYGVSRWGLGVVVAFAVATLAVAAPASGLLATPLREWVAAAIGILVGAVVRESILRRRRTQLGTHSARTTEPAPRRT
jgi:hypothetical protein